MPGLNTKRVLYRTRTVRNVVPNVAPIVSKHLIDFQADEVDAVQRKPIADRSRNSFRTIETVLDRIISKLRGDTKPQDILLMITPASRHSNLYKLHVIQRHEGGHLGMTTITHKELSRLKSSKAFVKYCIVFGSRYLDLKTVVLQTETIKSLVDALNKKCCTLMNKKSVESQLKPITNSKSNISSAGDYLDNQEKSEIIKRQDSSIQTDPEVEENVSFTISDILTLIETINQTLEPSIKDIHRFFFMADKLHFYLVVRPEMLWTTTTRLSTTSNQKETDLMTYQVESYLPGNCYLGCISLFEKELLHELDLYPNLLLNIHVIQDVFEITPLPRFLIIILRQVLTFFKLELLYDALGEFFFDWFKNSTYL